MGCLLRALRCLSVSHGSECSGDSDGLYSEWSRWVDILRMYGYFTTTRQMPRALSVAEASIGVGTRIGTVTDTGRQVSGGAGGIGHGWESVTRASTLDPDGGMLEVSRGELIWGLTAH
ncbi:hypothetical protein TIFTF001_036693 [Ficus carica]|uniref:Uncharacterized protein n=1 Tax=Ficus carica TaxID=3494 RepID=A0AA88E4S7_FICCA|nr:hypothetical protein TIFTF001_036693 [Ficus carica]